MTKGGARINHYPYDGGRKSSRTLILRTWLAPVTGVIPRGTIMVVTTGVTTVGGRQTPNIARNRCLAASRWALAFCPDQHHVVFRFALQAGQYGGLQVHRLSEVSRVPVVAVSWLRASLARCAQGGTAETHCRFQFDPVARAKGASEGA